MNMDICATLLLLLAASTVYVQAQEEPESASLSPEANENRLGAADVLSQLISSLGNSLGLSGSKVKFPDFGEHHQIDKKLGVAHDSKTEYNLPTCPSCRTGHGENIGCGQPMRNARIVNGTEPNAGAYPWAVGIQFVDKLYCGGTLINNQFIITAAHCIKGINPDRIKLIIGDHDRRQQEVNQETRRIKQVFIHPLFEKKTFNNDIALVKMDREVQFSNFVRPVCLPNTDRSYNGHNTTVVGWGKLAEGGLPAKTLQEVTVPIITQKKCRHETSYSKSEITENMICAGYDNGQIDACQGDSGGPMVWKGSGESSFTQIGIVSWGQGCARAGYPGVYTRIGRYIEWIIKQLQENNTCLCRKL